MCSDGHTGCPSSLVTPVGGRGWHCIPSHVCFKCFLQALIGIFCSKICSFFLEGLAWCVFYSKCSFSTLNSTLAVLCFWNSVLPPSSFYLLPLLVRALPWLGLPEVGEPSWLICPKKGLHLKSGLCFKHPGFHHIFHISQGCLPHFYH